MAVKSGRGGLGAGWGGWGGRGGRGRRTETPEKVGGGQDGFPDRGVDVKQL